MGLLNLRDLTKYLKICMLKKRDNPQLINTLFKDSVKVTITYTVADNFKRRHIYIHHVAQKKNKLRGRRHKHQFPLRTTVVYPTTISLRRFNQIR